MGRRFPDALTARDTAAVTSLLGVECFRRDLVALTDGTHLPADIVGEVVADRVGRVRGPGSGTAKDPGPWEGEERDMWKPTRQQNLWFQGGNLQQARFYSLLLGLQLKARQEGIETPVHGLAEVHHTR